MYASEDLEQGIEILRSGKHLCLYRCPELHVSEEGHHSSLLS